MRRSVGYGLDKAYHARHAALTGWTFTRCILGDDWELQDGGAFPNRSVRWPHFVSSTT